MTLTLEQKAEIKSKFAISEKDSGSAPVQIALITNRINYLQGHFKLHPKDHHSRRGLLKLVGRRRRLLDYIKKNDIQKYRDMLVELEIRK